jgi:hypothetical protein
MRPTLIALAAVTAVGCIADGSAHALYAGPPRPRDQVARLGGYVQKVDGRDVSSLGGAFELEPGCHIVETPSSWGKSSNDGAVVATTGHLIFALPMKAGHGYSISVEVEQSSGPVGGLTIQGTETTADGERTRVFGLATQDEINACLQGGVE